MKVILNLIYFLSLYSISFITVGENMSDDPFEFKGDPSQYEGEPISTATTFSLTSAEIESLKTEAKKGDNNAAFRLYEFYEFSDYNLEKSKLWELKSAELGNTAAQYNVAVSFFDSSQFEQALFWCEKAKLGGNEKAKNLREKIKLKQSQNKIR